MYYRTGLLAVLTLLALSSSSSKAEPASEKYDIVLRNSRVIDPETGLDSLHCLRDIGITGDKVTKISKIPSDPDALRLDGTVIYDVGGMVVAPGFIDMHVHGMTIPALRMRAFDGVTTALELESGVLPVDDGYELIKVLGGSPINYGFSAAWTMARMAVMDGVEIDGNAKTFADNFGGCCWDQVAAPEQSRATIELVKACGLDQGSIGIGMNLGYAPKSNAEEFEMLAELARDNDTLVSVHLRDSASDLAEAGGPNIDALDEAIDLVRQTGAHIYINHISSTLNWKLEEGIEKITDAIANPGDNGGRLSAETLLYGAASTVVGTPATTAEALKGRRMTFRDVYHVGERRFMKSQEELDGYRERSPGDLIIMHFFREDDPHAMRLLDRAASFEHAVIASDSLPLQIGDIPLFSRDWPVTSGAFAHPRSMGTYGRLLRHYVREKRSVSLMEAIRRSSLLPAQILEAAVPAMKNKGRLQEGKDADIIVFDPDKVEDRATYSTSITAAGMMYVIVNGETVIREYLLETDKMPGRAIRGKGSSDGSTGETCSDLIESHVKPESDDDDKGGSIVGKPTGEPVCRRGRGKPICPDSMHEICPDSTHEHSR